MTNGDNVGKDDDQRQTTALTTRIDATYEDVPQISLQIRDINSDHQSIAWRLSDWTNRIRDGWSTFTIAAGALITGALLIVLSRRRHRKKFPMSIRSIEPTDRSPYDLRKPNARIRMLSTFQVWGPTHPSHQAPWEAPKRVAAFMFRVERGSTTTSDLLFVERSARSHGSGADKFWNGQGAPAQQGSTTPVPNPNPNLHPNEHSSTAEVKVHSFRPSRSVSSLAVDESTSSCMPALPATASGALDRAGSLLSSGAYQDALNTLTPLLSEDQPPEEASVLAASAWWKIAEDSGSSSAYKNAADALFLILERNPTRLDTWYRAGICRLLQAAGESGITRLQSLDNATSALKRALPDYTAADVPRLLTLADALQQRALATPGLPRDRVATSLAEVTEVLRIASRICRDPASLAAMRFQHALQLQARFTSGTNASALRLQADTVLSAGLDAAPEADKANWLIAKVENELARAELSEGASRAVQLRSFRDAYRKVLTGPGATADSLFAWLELLALETSHLRGEPLRLRLEEGIEVLGRLDQFLPANEQVAYIRSMLLKRRALSSTMGSRSRILSDAIQCLTPFIDRSDLPEFRLEAAELTLLRAASQPSRAEAEAEFALLERLVSPLAERSALAMPAIRCLVEASLAIGTVDEALCSRLVDLAPHDTRAQWLLASAALRMGHIDAACSHCETAVASLHGKRPEPALLQLWEDAKLLQRRALPNSAVARHT